MTHAQSATVSASTDTLDEVTVTAERRTESAQKTGASVSVRSGDDLQKEGKFSLSSILEDVPGIAGGAAAATGGTGGGGTDTPASGLIIRGIPANTGAGGSVTSTAPAAAIYVDGVYSGIGGGYDIDRVETLRGPQGTLYGRSATAGVVSIHTYDPKLDAIGGDATVEAGNYNLRHYTAALNLPIVTDKLAIRVAGNRYQRDGFTDAVGGAVRSTDGKIKVLYKPNDNFSLLVGAALQDNEDHTGGHIIGSSPNPDKVVYIDVGRASVTNNFRQYWAELNWNLGFATLTYLPAFRSWTNEGTLSIFGAGGAGAQTLSTPKDHFITHEVRLSSNADSKLTWQIGTMLYNNQLEDSSSVYIGPQAPGNLAFTDGVKKETKAYGVFAQATYPVTAASRVTAGLRYDKTKVSQNESLQLGNFLVGPGPLPPPFTLTGNAGKRDFSNLTYKVRLEHDLTAANLMYASVSTGFSPGDVTVTVQCPPSISLTSPCPIALEAETLTSYELGSKNRFLADTLQLNASVFYSKYGAFQSAGINVNPNGFPPLFAPLAVPLETYGLELETLYKFTPKDLLGLNVGWTKAHYVSKPPLFALYVAEDNVSSNSSPQSAAAIPVSATLSYQHTFTLAGGSTLAVRGQALYTSSHDGDFTQQQKLDGQERLVEIHSAVLGNLSATWTANKYVSVTGYVRNVADHQYITKSVVNGLPGPPPTQYVYQQVLNDRRTVGLLLNVGF